MDKLIPFAAIIAMPLLWVAVSNLLSQMSGWAKLADCFPDRPGAQGRDYYLLSGHVGGIQYGSCLNLRVCENGLRLAVLFPFRIGHPPLFIPWQQFHNASEKTQFFSRRLQVQIGTPVLTSLVLPLWVGDSLAKYSVTSRHER